MTMSVDPNDPNTRIDGTGTTIRQLDSLLRGEISAAETYRMALDRVRDSDKTASDRHHQILREMQEEHGRAAQALRNRIRELGGDASDASGVWGAFAKMTQGTANLFGNTSALKSLKEGEVHGLKDYQAAVDVLDPTSTELVQNQMIPAQQRHISLLDSLINTAGRT